MSRKRTRNQTPSQDTQPAAGARSSAPGGVGNAAKADAALGQFSAATQGAGRPVPDLAEMEALFGEDLSDVQVHWGQGAAMEAMGARAATDGESIAMGPNATQASLLEELVHVVQARRGGGGGSGTSDPSDPHEQEASGLAQQLAAGHAIDPSTIGGLSGGGAIHRDADRGALNYGSSSTEIADASAVQGELDATPEQKAQELSSAIRGNDMRTIVSLLAGENSAVNSAYSAYFGHSAATDMIQFLSYANLTRGLAYARTGEAGLESRIAAVTWDIMGTDHEKLYGILESASLEDRLAMANNAVIIFYITNDTSGSVRERCLSVLRPLMDQSGLSVESREALFEAIRQGEAQLSSQVSTLVTRLDARLGWLDDDEDGMIDDVTAWMTARGTGFPELTASNVEPAELAPAVEWLRGQLSSRQFEQALNIMRTAGQTSVMDSIDEAGSDTTWGISDTDEDGIYTALAGATLEQRQAILASPTELARVMSYLDEGEEQDRAMALLRAGGTGESATAYQELLAELDSNVYISDATVWDCLERMAPADLVRLRDDPALYARIENGVSDNDRLRDLVGYTGACTVPADGSDPGAELAASNARLVARLEHAVDSWDDDEDLVYQVVLEWQAAGGVMDATTDAALLSKARSALGDLDSARRTEIMDALNGTRLITWQDRLESASSGAGTDNTGMDATLKDVPDIVLVREWSNLSDYKAQAEAVCTAQQATDLTGFIVDINNDVKYMLSEERGDWRDLLGDLRGRLIEALRAPTYADMVRREFHYVARAEMLVRLQYAQAREVAEDDRGAGFWNGISMGLNDSWSATGVATEQAFGSYRTEATEAVAAVDGSAEEQQQITEADAAYQTFLTSHEEYEAAKASAAAIAGGIVGVIVATIVTIATAGTAGPACAAFLGTVIGATFTELTEAAIQGNSYDVEEGAQDMLVSIVTGAITLGMGQLVDKLAKGAAATTRIQAINAALKTRFGDTFARYAGTVGTAGLDSALSTFPSKYAEDLIRTEGLLRQELGGATGALSATLQDFGTTMITKGLTSALNDRTDLLAGLRASGDWDEYSDQLLQKGLIDLAITTGATQLLSGTPPSAQDMVKLICKVASTNNSARVTAQSAEKDVSATLDFFNSADSETLQTVKFIGPALAARIIQERGAGGLTSLNDLTAIPRFTERVLTPAASEIRDDYLRLRDREQLASPSTATGN